MKFKLPEKRWKKMLFITLLVLLVVFAIMFAYLEYSVYREVPTSIEVKNPQGAKTALLLFHPGLTAFSNDVSYAFADGLASKGWRVEITTASSEAPTDLSNYDMLVLSWPIYDFNPGPTISNHIRRIGNLQKIDTVILTIGGGINPFNSQEAMKNIVQEANGTIREVVTIFRGGNFAEKAFNMASEILP